MSVVNSLNILVGMDVKDVQAGARATKAELNGLGGDAKKIWDETRTPQERYEDRLQRLAGQVKAGAIDQETFARAMRKASLEMAKAGNAPGFAAGTADVHAYVAKLEELSTSLATGALSQGQFAAAASAAGQAMEAAGGAAGSAAEGHAKGGHAANEYQAEVQRLDLQLAHGKITFDEYGEKVEQAKEKMERAEHAAERMEKAMDVLKVTFATLGIAYGLEATAEFLKGSWEAADEAAASLGRLEAIVKATGGAAGLSAREMREYARGIQETTNYSHLEVEAAEAVLATHRQIAGMNFRGAVAAAADVAAVLGTDMRSAAIQVGRALADPTNGLGGLSRAGITFTQSEREVIQHLVAGGHAAQAQATILEKLKESMGDAAESMRTDAKGIENAWDDLKEAFGTLMQSSGARQGAKATEGFILDVAKALDDVGEAADRDGNRLRAWGNLVMAINKPAFWMLGLDTDRRFTIEREEKEESEKKPELPQESEQHRKARESLEKLMTAMREETALAGLEGNARDVARLKLQGLSEAELSEARALSQAQAQRKREIDQLAEQKKRVEELTGSVKQFRDSLRHDVDTFGMNADDARIKQYEQELADAQAVNDAAREKHASSAAAQRAGFDSRGREIDEAEKGVAGRRADFERRYGDKEWRDMNGNGLSGPARRDMEREEAELAADERALADRRAALASEREAAGRENAKATYDLEMQERELDLSRQRLEDSKSAAQRKRDLERDKQDAQEARGDFAAEHTPLETLDNLKKQHDAGQINDEDFDRESREAFASAKEAAREIRRSIETPQEKFEREIKRLEHLHDAGLITNDEFGRAGHKAEKERDEALHKAEHKETPALLKGSAEAFHAVARFQNPRNTVEKQSLAELKAMRKLLYEQGKAERRANNPSPVRKI